MSKLIGYCGLNCETCDARIATINNDDELKEKTAELWSKLNGTLITKEMINCEGCRMDGVKFPFCEKMCPIRICAMNKKIDQCALCDEVKACEKIKMIKIDENEYR